MPHITRNLLRKRAEHNEGIISTLEEISLHQEELESINEVLGMTCRKLKILYLQNNIIPKMENLYHMKDLEYLNLALNNITKIEGLDNCEFLRKLDLTVNFVDFDTLKESIEHLQPRENLRELFLLGNPAQANWDESKFRTYVIAKLPQLTYLDGTEITKSMQIKARQQLPKLEAELIQLAKEVQAKKATNKANIVEQEKSVSDNPVVEDVDEEIDTDDFNNPTNEMTENTPEARIKIYKELAQQKKEKEDRSKVNAPKERDYEREQAEALAEVRKKEAESGESEIKQKNEGGWEFFWDEDSKPGHIILDVRVQKFLDSSLIDVDIHPTYLSIVIKAKVLRLRLPAEVKVGESKCQRSKTTGALLVVMPKVNPKETVMSLRSNSKVTNETTNRTKAKPADANRVKYNNENTATKKLSMQELMLQEAMQATSNITLLDNQIGTSNNINLGNIVKKSNPQPEPTLFSFANDATESQSNSKISELD